jgi:hypothetical protein
MTLTKSCLSLQMICRTSIRVQFRFVPKPEWKPWDPIDQHWCRSNRAKWLLPTARRREILKILLRRSMAKGSITSNLGLYVYGGAAIFLGLLGVASGETDKAICYRLTSITIEPIRSLLAYSRCAFWISSRRKVFLIGTEILPSLSHANSCSRSEAKCFEPRFTP